MVIGSIEADKPRTNIIFRIFAPRTLPIEISWAFLMIAVIDVTSSGNDVPKAVNVRPIMTSGTPSILAMTSPLETSKLAPEIVQIIPIIKRKTFLITVFLSRLT